jgi:hypothetical protein
MPSETSTPRAGQSGAVARTVPATSLPQVTVLTIGKTTATLGGSVTVDARDAVSTAGGLCQFAIRHTARAGPTPTDQFATTWENGAVGARWSRTSAPIAAGGTDIQTHLITLKPGTNELRLTVRGLGQRHDSREANGHGRVIVNLTGSCASGPARAPSR